MNHIKKFNENGNEPHYTDIEHYDDHHNKRNSKPIKSAVELYNEIVNLVKRISNDNELGEEVRKIVNG